MNRIYRQVWNEARQCWMAAPETAKGRGKCKPALRKGVLALATAAAFGVQAAPPANTLPTGGQVVAGQAAISTAGSTMTIQQASDKAILNWQSFSIGSGAAVNFVQPSASSVALNRVLGNNPSEIYGRLTANGQVFLINPSGILFAPGSQVDVGGLVASTMNIRNEDFLGGLYRFTRDGTSAAVVNQGAINAKYAALLGPRVLNEGVIAAPMGSIALAAGEAVTLGITGQSRLSVQVDKATIDTLVENRHLVKADGGAVLMSAQSANALLGSVVNSGTVEASGISTDGGVVRLLASSNIEHSGVIRVDAGTNGKGGTAILLADLSNPASRTDVSGAISARGGAQSGDGGFIETSAARLAIRDSARVDTSAANGRSGQWLLDPYDFTIAPTGGDISGTALAAALDANSVTIETLNASVNCTGIVGCGTGNAAGNGDIHVNQEVSWTGGNLLTLSAWRNVNINAPLTATTGSLRLAYGQSDVAGNTPDGTYTVRAPITLPAGSNFSTKYGSDGAVDAYTVVRTRPQLEAIALTDKVALGGDIDLSATDWTPLGASGAGFTGTFAGLRNKLTGLKTSNESAEYVGLFAEVSANGTVRNLGLTGVNLKGRQYVGAVAGKVANNGTVSDTYSTGTITGSTNGADTILAIGGLVGANEGRIERTYSAVNVSATGGIQAAGNGTDGGIGGLVGVNTAGSIFSSYATGNVSGGQDVGGLLGYAGPGGTIQSVYSRGAVNATVGGAGGLIGASMMFGGPTITDATWDTDTSTQMASAGTPPPTGNTTADMKKQTTFVNLGGSTYDFTNTWTITEDQSYPLLRTFLTPLIVYAWAPTNTKTYNAQALATTSAFSIGTPDAGKLTTTTITVNNGGKDAGAKTITPSGPASNDVTDQHGYLVSFVSGTGTINTKALTVDISGVVINRAYNGSQNATGAVLLASEAAGGATAGKPYTGDDVSLTGSMQFDTKNVGAASVGVGTLALAGVDGLANYTLTAPANITVGVGITPVALTINNPVVANKPFDGTTTATVTNAQAGSLAGFVGTETVTASVNTATFADAAIGPGKNVTVTYTLSNGANGGIGTNYSLANKVVMADITTPAPVETTSNTNSTNTLNQVTTPVIQQGSTSPNNVPPGTRNFIPNPQARVSTGVSVTTAISFAGPGTPGQGATQALPLSAIRILQSLTQAWGDPEVAKAFAAMFASSLVDALPDTVSGNKFNLTIQPQTSQ